MTFDAKTRQISDQELPLILEPMVDGKRKKVKDTSILTICAQKIIAHLGIHASSQQTEAGLMIRLSLKTAEESTR